MSKLGRRLTWAAVLVATGLAGVGVWAIRSSRGTATPLFETASVDRGRVTAKVTATGTLSALVTVQVGSQVSGRIQVINVDFNSPVKAGQELARIDPQLFTAAEEQARANLVAARGNLEKATVQAADARRQHERSRDLYKKKLVAKADLDTARTTSLAAEATIAAGRGAVEQAQAALHQAEVNVGYTHIVSPTDGVVISRNVDVGQTVAASFQAPVLFVIAQDLRKMQVDSSVAEADVGRLSSGMDASFTVDAYPGEVFRGAVRQIRNAPQTLQNVVTYDAVIDVDNEALKLRPGMTANVTFVYADKKDVLRVPNAALRFSPSPELLAEARGTPKRRATVRRSGRPPPGTGTAAAPAKSPATADRTVWVLNGRAPRQERIAVGASDGTYSEVTSGPLAPGDRVVTSASGQGSSSAPPRAFRLF